jgi:hypothetical protein
MVRFLVSNFWGKSFFVDFSGDETVDEILDRLEAVSRGAKYILPIGQIPDLFVEKLKIVRRGAYNSYLELLLDEVLEDIYLDKMFSHQSVVKS